jgi:hypothetical protein
VPFCRSYQIVENTFVKDPFLRSALPELLITVVEALPVLAELLQTVLVDVFNSVRGYRVSTRFSGSSECPFQPMGLFVKPRAFPTDFPTHPCCEIFTHGFQLQKITSRIKSRHNLHALGTSSNPSALLQAVCLTLPCALVLTLHEIVIVRLAPCSNEETCR